MKVVEVGRAISSGVSIVCATCERYWEGREKKLPGSKCTTLKPCGSPFAALTFPEYDGPMTDFGRWCFVCGTRADKGVRVREEPRIIGMCNEHIKMLGQLEPIELKLNGESMVDIIDRHFGRMSQHQYFGPPRKTLIDTMIETEMEWAEDDEKKKRRRCG